MKKRKAQVAELTAQAAAQPTYLPIDQPARQLIVQHTAESTAQPIAKTFFLP